MSETVILRDLAYIARPLKYLPPAIWMLVELIS